MYDDERPSADMRVLNQINDMRSMARQLFKSSKKCELDEVVEQQKAMAAIRENNLDKARSYGESAIVKHNEAQNYVKLATRLEAVVSRLDTQVKMNTINASFASVVKALKKTVEKNSGSSIMSTMEAFETTFKQLDEQTASMTTFMDATLAQKAPATEVDLLLAKLADTHNLETTLDLPRATPPAAAPPADVSSTARQAAPALVAPEGDVMSELQRRFDELKRNNR